MALYPDALVECMSELSGLLLSDATLDATLYRVCELAIRAIPNGEAVGLALIENGRAQTSAATSGVVYDVDSYQYDIGEGPCLSAIRDGTTYEIESMATDARWPRFAEYALARGLVGSLSIPLRVRQDLFGALNLYSSLANPFSDGDREIAAAFASQAAVAVANAQTFAATKRLADQLEEALVSRAVIDQAKGVLMAQRRCSADEAFEILRTASQRHNRKLRDLARDLVEAIHNGHALPPV